MGCLYVLALEVGSLVGLSACGACPGGWSPAQRAPFQGRVGRHGGESVAAGSDSRVPLGAGAPPTRRLRGPTRRVARSHAGSVAPPHWHSQWTSPRPSGRASGTFKLRLEKRVGARGRGCLAPLGPSRMARRPRRVPLAGASGGRATTVCAPLPLGDLPTSQQWASRAQDVRSAGLTATASLWRCDCGRSSCAPESRLWAVQVAKKGSRASAGALADSNDHRKSNSTAHNEELRRSPAARSRPRGWYGSCQGASSTTVLQKQGQLAR